MPARAARRVGLLRGNYRRFNTGIKALEPVPEDIEDERFVPVAPVPIDPTVGPFTGKSAAEVLERLRSGQLQSAEKGSGGRTLAFKVTLESGVQAYYKPEQRLASANWYAEVAAFYLDRALGLGRVPPVVSRRLAWKQLEAAAVGDSRSKTVAVDRTGNVRGALIAWLPDELLAAGTPPGWEAWLCNEPWNPLNVTPYQSAATYKQGLAAQRQRRTGGEGAALGKREAPPPARDDLPAELSDMIVFDFLTANAERFGDDNANLLTLGAKGPLVFLDNGSGFSPGPAQQGVLNARLSAVSKFRWRTIDALRALDVKTLKATMAADPLGPILDAAMLRGLEARRTAVLEHVAREEKRFGDAVFAW
jgi:hypothetical protein